MSQPRQDKRRRAGVCLLLYLLTAAGAARVIAQSPETAEKLGALVLPVGFLIAGCWFAYKDGGKLARIFASALVLLALGSFGFGIIKGYHSRQSAHEVDAEVERIRAGYLKDSGADSTASEAAKRHWDRTQDAARRLQASDNDDSAALGRAMQSIAALSRDSDDRLVQAIDAVSGESFLSVGTMLDDGDFQAQRATAVEYQSAAQACCDGYKRMPEAAERELAHCGMSSEHAAMVMAGYRKTWALSMRVFESHLQTAKCYVAFIDFVEAKAESMSLNAEGLLEFSDEMLGSEYDKVSQAVASAITRLNASVEALSTAIAKK